jgi:hypothetical protein
MQLRIYDYVIAASESVVEVWLCAWKLAAIESHCRRVKTPNNVDYFVTVSKCQPSKMVHYCIDAPTIGSALPDAKSFRLNYNFFTTSKCGWDKIVGSSWCHMHSVAVH